MRKGIAVAVPDSPFHELTYLPEDGSTAEQYQPGIRVRVPLNRATRVGIVMGVVAADDAGIRYRRILNTLDETPLLSAHLLELCRWVAQYYYATPGDALNTALPRLLRSGKPPAQRQIGWYRPSEQGLQPPPLPEKQRLAMQWLLESHPASGEQLGQQGLMGYAIPALMRKGLVERYYQPQEMTLETPPKQMPAPKLNPQQAEAVEAVSLQGFSVSLLQGVTGSGKTEVYLELMRRVLEEEPRGQILLLVPEISLTPQLLDWVRQRIARPVYCLHSAMSDRERLNCWQACASSEVSVLIGARSSVFTTLPNLRLIVVDEEHDASYKEQSRTLYSARDVAVMRASMLKIPAILGSGTPSLESLRNTRKPEPYQLLTLNEDARQIPSPEIRAVDLRTESTSTGIAQTTLREMQRTLDAGQQVLLYKDQRGYAHHVQCNDCDWLHECENCSTCLTLHQRRKTMLCHLCGGHQQVPRLCHQCNSKNLQTQDPGTEQIEQELNEQFPDIPVVRIDRDTMTSWDRYRDTLNELRGTNSPALIVGTRMMSKGHDLPNLHLVCALNADQGLFSSDLRTVEYKAQLLIQLAGRAGRTRERGLVLLQTRLPEHPLIQSVLAGDYPALAEQLLTEREQKWLPPYTRLVVMRCQGTDPDKVQGMLSDVLSRHTALLSQQKIRAVGPFPAWIERRQRLYHWHVHFIGGSRKALEPLLQQLYPLTLDMRGKNLRLSLDIDPVETT